MSAKDSMGQGIANAGGSVAGSAVGGFGGKMVGQGVTQLLNSLLGGGAQGRRDPQVAFMYNVELNGLTMGMFTECSGIKWSMETEPIKEGGMNNHEQNLLGRAKFTPLVLKRGFVGGDGVLFDMMHQTFDPNIPVVRKMVSLVVLGRSKGGGGGFMGFDELGRINFYECFVQEWEGPSFGTSKNEIAVESITFKYDYLEFHPGGAGDQLLGAALGGAMSLGAGMALAGKTPKAPSF